MIFSSFFSTFWIIILVQSALSQNSELKCPGFINNIEAFLDLTIDNTTFSRCRVPPQAATCSFKPLNGTAITLCSASVRQCAQPSVRCKCVEERQDGYSYNLSFIPQRDIDTNGSFSCTIDCIVLAGNRPTVYIGQSCTVININEPSTTVATTSISTISTVNSSSASINTAPTATSAEHPSPTCSSTPACLCEGSCISWCEENIVICILSIVICLLVGIGIIICIYCFAIEKERKIYVPDDRNFQAEVQNIQYQKSGYNKLTIEQKSDATSKAFISIKCRNIIPLRNKAKEVKDIFNKKCRNTGTGHGMEMSDSKPSKGAKQPQSQKISKQKPEASSKESDRDNAVSAGRPLVYPSNTENKQNASERTNSTDSTKSPRPMVYPNGTEDVSTGIAGASNRLAPVEPLTSVDRNSYASNALPSKLPPISKPPTAHN